MIFDFQFAFMLNWGFISDYLVAGLIFSLSTTAIATLGGFLFGTLLALMRLSPFKILSAPAVFYITVMRSIPLIMVLIWFYLVIPLLTGRQIGAEYSAIITFTLFEAAYYAEIIRAGLKSIQQGQYGASIALGMSTWQMYRLIILPQVIRAVSPILLTQTIILFQDTSLVYVLSVTDFLGAAAKIAQRDSRLVEMYLTVAVVYFLLCVLASQGVALLKRRHGVATQR